METIKNYLENMFAAMPQNEQVLKLKANLAESMEDKYNELKQQGRTENEAIGIVISEFGNIDELIREYGIEINPKGDAFGNNAKFLSDNEVEDVLRVTGKFGKVIAFGVWLCIMAPAVLVMLGVMLDQKIQFVGENSPMGIKMDNTYGAIILFPFFIMIAIAVGLFIYAGTKMEKYEYIKKTPVEISSTMRNKIQDLKEKSQSKFTMLIITGVMLCILSPMAVVSTVIMDEENSFLQGCGVVFLLVMIAFAVVLFILAGTKKDLYGQLLQEGDYSVENKKENKVVEAVAAVYWPLVTAIYLGWSFITMNWGFTWIIWPVAGVAFGGFAAVANIIADSQKKN